jgi:hypothetical protein
MYGNKKLEIYYGQVAKDDVVCQMWRYCITSRQLSEFSVPHSSQTYVLVEAISLL